MAAFKPQDEEAVSFSEGSPRKLTTRRGDFARLVLRLHELDGKLDGLGNDLKILRLCLLPVAAALSRTLSDTHSRVIQEFATNRCTMRVFSEVKKEIPIYVFED